MERLTIKFGDGLYESANPIDIYDNGYSKANYNELVKWLGGYEDLEGQGKLLELPVSVGDTVYEVQRLRKRIQPYEIISIKISGKGGRYYYWELKDGHGIYGNLKGFGDRRLGLDVFPTRREAEAALEKL